VNFQFLRETPVELSRYLPVFIVNDTQFRDILKSCGTEHEKLRLLLQDIVRQFFVETATWGLSAWERVLAISPRAGDNAAMRRHRILLRLQGKQVSTVRFMEQLSSYYFPKNATIYIQEQNEKYAFRLISNAISNDYSSLIEAIEEFKPAHLAFVIDYLIECEVRVFFSGYVSEYEHVEIESGGAISYIVPPAQIYVSGFIHGLEIIEIGSV